ncbi:MAG: ribosome small subunit-dependent GTPase A [Bacteroidales bacterium]
MEQGLVLKSTGSNYSVLTDNGEEIECKIKGKFRLQGKKNTNPIAVGDKVILERDGKKGIISQINDRTNYIIRKSSNLSKESHIIAANIDQAMLMVTITMPKTLLTFVDRFLVSAEAYNIPVILLFNKIDIYSSQEIDTMNEWMNIYKDIGYRCVQLSVEKSINLYLIKELLENKITLLSGNSGVGKSSLINALKPSLKLKTGTLSKNHQKGKHTTTFAEMFRIENHTYIIDTPGLKAFGLFDMKPWEIGHYFPEIFEHSQKCQFKNCTHVHEPGCAVSKAVDEGIISISRFNSYLSFLDGDEEKYRYAE